jgi:hypothetical protein
MKRKEYSRRETILASAWESQPVRCTTQSPPRLGAPEKEHRDSYRCVREEQLLKEVPESDLHNSCRVSASHFGDIHLHHAMC